MVSDRIVGAEKNVNLWEKCRGTKAGVGRRGNGFWTMFRRSLGPISEELWEREDIEGIKAGSVADPLRG